MAEDQSTTSDAEAAEVRAQALQKFWMTCMDRIVAGGASELEAAMQMLVVAGSYVGRACGADGAMRLLGDQALFYGRLTKAENEAVAEAVDAPKH